MWGFGWLTKLRKSETVIEAATQLTPVPVPKKVANKQLAAPSYIRTASPNPDTALPRADRRLINTDLETYRSGLDTRQVIRDYVAASPDLAGSVNAYIRTAITAKYTAVAKNMDGTFNRD